MMSFAYAQSFTVLDDYVLDGVSAPSVAHNGRRWVMLFEQREAPVQGCVETWSLGQAVSNDGEHFMPIGYSFGGPGAFSACGSRSPSLVVTDDHHIAVAFEAVQADGSVRIAIADNSVVPMVVREATELAGLVQPSLMRHDGTWYLMALDPAQGLMLAEGSLAAFVLDPVPVIPTGAMTWASSGIQTVTLNCFDDAMWPRTGFYSGRYGSDLSLGQFASNAAGSWYVSTVPYAMGVSTRGGFDSIDDGIDTAVYYDWTDGVGVPHIGVMVNGGIPDPALVYGRDCHP